MNTPPRIYLTGNTFPLRAEIRAAGGRWDKERKAWYCTPALRPVMQALAAKAKAQGKRARNTTPDDDQRVIGDGIHTKGNVPVFIAWLGRVAKTGFMTARLITRDGRGFWAPAKELKVTRRYEKPLPLAGLLAQIESH